MGIKGLRSYLNNCMNEVDLKPNSVGISEVCFCIDAKNVHYTLYRTKGRGTCDFDKYRRICEDYVSIFSQKSVKGVWFFPGPAPPKKQVVILDRQKNRYKQAVEAYNTKNFKKGFFHQISMVDILKSVLDKYKQEIIYTTGEIDDVMITYANHHKAYIITDDTDFIVQKNLQGVIQPFDISITTITKKIKKNNNASFDVVQFYSIDYYFAMNALGFRNEEQLYILIYLVGNGYEQIDKDVRSNIQRKYNVKRTYDSLNIYDCVDVVKQLYCQEGELSDKLTSGMAEVVDEVIEKINQDLNDIRNRYSLLLSDSELDRNILKTYIPNYIIDMLRYRQYTVPPAIPVEENRKFMIMSERIIDFLASFLDVGDSYFYITDEIAMRKTDRKVRDMIRDFIYEEGDEDKEKYDENDINTMIIFLDKYDIIPKDTVIKLFYIGLDINFTNVEDSNDYYFYICIKLLQRFCDNESFIKAVILLISCPSYLNIYKIVNNHHKIIERYLLEVVRYQIDMEIILENMNSIFWVFNLNTCYDSSLLMKLTRDLLSYVLYNIQEDESYPDSIVSGNDTWVENYEKIKSWL